MTCSVEGDELTSYVKILFFKALLSTYVFGVFYFVYREGSTKGAPSMCEDVP